MGNRIFFVLNFIIFIKIKLITNLLLFHSMGGNFEFNEQNIKRVEMFLHKLKYSVLPSDIIKWLRNFNKEDVPHALDILKVFEYIPFNEFMNRINILLKIIYDKIPINERVIIFPYGKVGKSGTIVTYPFRNTDVYRKRENEAQLNGYIDRDNDYNIITHDLKNISSPERFKHIIFLDDFVGSGNTFLEAIAEEETFKWLEINKLKSYNLLAAITMEEGEKNINHKLSKLKVNIVSDTRYKAFNSQNSIFDLFENKTEILRIVDEYGNKISKINFGYDNSESLIAFFYGTPNNTFPIIWCNKKKWIPLFPRMAQIRMAEASKLKKDIKYYFLLCEKLGLNIIEDTKEIHVLKDSRSNKEIKEQEQNHAVLALIYLKNKGYENIFISQMLGLTRTELIDVYIEAEAKGLVDSKYINLTSKALDVLQKMKKRRNADNVREETNENLTIKDKNKVFIPNTFMGMK